MGLRNTLGWHSQDQPRLQAAALVPKGAAGFAGELPEEISGEPRPRHEPAAHLADGTSIIRTP
eukprot:7884941-Pyramimonas_sp.AAC.1